MMKNFIKAAISTLPHIFKVLVLLALHIYMFAMLGLLVFPRQSFPTNGTNDTAYPVPFGHIIPWLNYSDATIITDYSHYVHLESMHYFSSTVDALINLIVLLTTANNPDMMIPIYQFNRFSALYFILYFLIGASIIFNLLIVATYNQFKESFEKSLKEMFVRRRVGFKAAFKILTLDDDTFDSVVLTKLVKKLKCRIPKSQISLIELEINKLNDEYEINWTLFQDIFKVSFPEIKEDDAAKDTSIPANKDTVRAENDEARDNETSDTELEDNRESNVAPNRPFYRFKQFTSKRYIHKIFHHRICSAISHIISIINVILITIQLEIAYDKSFKTDSQLAYYNLVFIIYYTIEMISKIITINCACESCKQYFTTIANIYDFIITIILIILELFVVVLYGSPFHLHDPILDLKSLNIVSRLLSIVTVLRLFRLVIQINSLRFLVFTLINLLWNLRGFFGVMIAIYYFFAFLGMELFYNVDGPSDPKSSCAPDYDNLHYYANGFHDFAASLVTLWNVMIVNNWFIFLNKFACDSFLGKWAKLYFIAWWIVSAILVDLFISFVLEIFSIKWKKEHKEFSNKEGSRFNCDYMLSQCSSLKNSCYNCKYSSLKNSCYNCKYSSLKNSCYNCNEIQTSTSLAQGWSEVCNNIKGNSTIINNYKGTIGDEKFHPINAY
jgi:two pore calcium channel protein 2